MTKELEKIKSLVAKNKLDDAINLLNTRYLEEQEKDALIQLSKRINLLKEDDNKGILKHEEKIIESNKIGASLLSLISRLSLNNKVEKTKKLTQQTLITTKQINLLIEGQRKTLKYFTFSVIITLFLGFSILGFCFYIENDSIKVVLFLACGLMFLLSFYSFRLLIGGMEKINIFKILLQKLDKSLHVEMNSQEVQKINDLVWRKIENSLLN